MTPPSITNNLKKTLSEGRISTYETAVTTVIGKKDAALNFKLYLWNASIAGAYIFPLHIYEVALRNAISSAISSTYTDAWPWKTQFIRSLSTKGRYSPQKDLQSCNQSHGTTGKVIPELKFAFWEHMLKSSHSGRIWRPHFRSAFPLAPTSKSIDLCLNELKSNNYKIRELRNRIAHHEPIFSRNLQDDYNKILQAINWICQDTAAWMDSHQRVSELLSQRPI